MLIVIGPDGRPIKLSDKPTDRPSELFLYARILHTITFEKKIGLSVNTGAWQRWENITSHSFKGTKRLESAAKWEQTFFPCPKRTVGYISTGPTSTMQVVVLSQTILTWLMLTEMRGFLCYSMNHEQSREQETDLGRSIDEDSFSETAVRTSDNPSLRTGLGLPASDAAPTSTQNHRNAKGFWNHFLFRRRSRFQSILPIQNNEVHALKCRAIPFSQVRSLCHAIRLTSYWTM